MPALLDRLPTGSRVLLIRVRSLGDCVLTTPAIGLLHKARPDLAIGVVVENRFAGVFEGNPAIRSILSPEVLPVVQFAPALTVNLHGGGRSVWLTRASGAPHRAGFAHYPQQWPYTIKIPRAQEILGVERPVHTAEHLASAMFYLGVEPQSIPGASLFASPPEPGHPYAVIHPLASATGKAWPAERFTEVARVLRQQWQLDPVFLAGPGEDLSAFAEFRQAKGWPLTEVKSLLSGATLFLGNDSGPAHLAAAFGRPVVVLFGPSNPVTWAPWRTQSRSLIAPEADLTRISVSSVLQALGELRDVTP